MIVTTGDPAVLASVKRQFPAVPAGLSIGGGLARAVRRSVAPLRAALSRAELAAAGLAGWAAIHRRLARAEVLTQCQRQGIKTMVWTVNADRELARWMATPGVDALVTDRPGRAVLLREHQLADMTAGKIPPEMPARYPPLDPGDQRHPAADWRTGDVRAPRARCRQPPADVSVNLPAERRVIRLSLPVSP